MEIKEFDALQLFPLELKSFLAKLIQLKENQIDFNRSKVDQLEKAESVSLIAVDDRFCPISFIVWVNKEKRMFQFCYSENGRVLEDQLDNFIADFQSSVVMYLSTEVEAELTYIKGRLVKGKYYYWFDFNGRSERIPYTGYQQFMIWPWQQKVREVHKYESWLSTDEAKLFIVK